MDEKLKTTIDKILRLCAQNPEFDKELRRRLGQSVSSLPIDDERMNQIYEYCLEKVVRRQAEDFYSNFPMPSVINVLVNDYCRMEFFRRKDAFGDFCLAVYQQIECITNKLCLNPDLIFISETMWQCPAYIKTGKDIIPSIENRLDYSKYSIFSLVFGKNAKEKNTYSLQSFSAIEKMKTIVYFIGYKAMMKSSDYDAYIEFTSLLRDIYQCRNMNHRGSEQSEWQKVIIDRITPHKGVYYLKFLGALTLFVEQIKEGWLSLPTIKAYADKISHI